jgi:hypothetical protein
MYCSKCGEADQNPNSYCRKCGYFLISNKTIFLILFNNCSLLFVSVVFLFSYLSLSDETFKELIYNFYIMIGVNLVLQFSNILSLIYLVRKMTKNSFNVHVTSEGKSEELTNLETNDLLPPADLQSIIPSVIEQTTKNLEKVERR